MARTCIDWEPDDPSPVAPRSRIVHVTKVPASDSGIARHAGPFDRALDRVGGRTTVGIALDASGTQRATAVLRLARRVLLHLRREPVDLVVIDLSGRALAEFFSACLVASIPTHRRPILWLVAHDAPEVVGAPMLFSFLDRKGGRRVGMALSRTVGRALERWLVGRADAVLAFSELGADALRERFGDGRVWSIPLPTELLANALKEPVVYCPAGVSATDILATMRAFEPGCVPPHVRLRIGNLPLPDRRQVEVRCRSMGIIDRVEFTGFLDQAGLDQSFATAAIVVRNRSATGRPSNWAAASGPVVSAMAAGCAVLSTDPRGSAYCLELGGSDLSATPDRLQDELVRVTCDPSALRLLAERATDHIRSTHVPEAVAPYLEAIWRDTGARNVGLPAWRTPSAPKPSSALR